MVAAIAVALMVPAAAAQAADIAVSGNTTSTSTSSPTNFTVTRYTTQSTVKFKPLDLLVQNNNPFVHQLYYRLNTTSNTALSSWQYFAGTGVWRTMISGYAVGQPFRAAASGYNSTIMDSYFEGRLQY